MRFALACYGTRGDIEPSVAVGRELQSRGHDVRIAVPPELVDFAESAGLPSVPYGPEFKDYLDEEFVRNLWAEFLRNFWTIRGPINQLREAWAPVTKYWAEMSATLKSLADEADLLFTGQIFQEPASNVAEYYGIPLATLHYLPVRSNGQLVRMVPSPLVRSAMNAAEWVFWRMTTTVEEEQRRELGLPKAAHRAPRRIAERKALEIQAYEEFCFPGLAAEWAKYGDQRPFVGTLTMELTTDADDEVTAWIGAGTPPICFCFGSIAVESASETVEMVSAACAELGQRALVCAGGSDFSHAPHSEHVKVVGPVNYAEIFPACRAVVHHGGAGTTAASLRSGVPTLILWTTGDQPLWGARIKQLNVGAARRLASATVESLVKDLRQILVPEYAARAREIAARMTKPAESVAKTADLLEDAVRRKASLTDVQ